MADNATFVSDIFNKMRNFPPLNDKKKNIGRSWCEWKQNFLSFLQNEDANELYKNQWPVILLMLIGPLGEQAYKDFPSCNALQMEDLETLLCYFDLYFIFGHRKRKKDENIENYIDSLMLVAIASNHGDPVNIVKEKIMQDIKNYNFTGKAMLFIQSKGNNLVSYLQLLDLHKITLFWKQCEDLMLQKNCKNLQQLSPNPQLAEMECIRCGTCHSRNHCPAHGMRCNNCNGYNHFTDYCKVKYVSDCIKCGTHHIQSRCLAFGEMCTNCGKANHFSWLCKVPVVKNCLRCGKDHAISMCPAQGQVCGRCNKPNHLKEKCLSKLNDE
ncbi:uncharacterized protein LOC115242844 isoform X1 [Formica exsecta]|uniref:uncharacterized protein LOC115242844 isoform X1 n=2 Tax=Formica exsecta TaxID=72781 RepID=UPI001143C534|nr:uncharacterized protein LOC115242844 isoform X1 [Formica exsecta]